MFSPVVKHSSIRVLLAMVAKFNLELEQLDVKTAFLHGELDEQIYMHQQEGFEIHGKEDHVCLLKKSLYGLKQSPCVSTPLWLETVIAGVHTTIVYTTRSTPMACISICCYMLMTC